MLGHVLLRSPPQPQPQCQHIFPPSLSLLSLGLKGLGRLSANSTHMVSPNPCPMIHPLPQVPSTQGQQCF